MAAYVAEMKKVAQKVTGRGRAAGVGRSVVPIASCAPPQIIDTVPMDETTEEMFGYFEPLYEVIHDMPRPPEAFFKRKGGEWEPLRPAHAQHIPHLCATLFSLGTSLLLFPACFCTGTAITSGLCSSPGHILLLLPEGGTGWAHHLPSNSPAMVQLLQRCLFGHHQTSVSSSEAAVSSVWAFSSQNFEART